MNFELSGGAAGVVAQVAEERNMTLPDALAWLIDFAERRLDYVDDSDFEGVPTGSDYGVVLR